MTLILTPRSDTVPPATAEHVAPLFDSAKNVALTSDNKEPSRAKKIGHNSANATVSASATATTAGAHSAPLVSTETVSHKPALAEGWERLPLELQRVVWEVTNDKALAGCHRWRAGGAEAVGVVWRGNKSGRFMGLQNSHSVWGSPLAALQITRSRREELARDMEAWTGADSRHSVMFLTLTLRHDSKQDLAALWDALGDCWSATTSGSGGWTGTKTYAGDKRRFGIAHWVKSIEVTHGKNGWHPHVHVALFLERTLSDDEIDVLQARMFKRWSDKAVKLGLKAPSAVHGIDLQQVKKGDDLGELAGYLTKGMVSGLGSEITGGAMKQARNGNRTPFQVLETMAADKAEHGRYSPRDVAIWREFERVSKGKNFMTWSKGMKKELGAIEVSDAEAAALAEQADDGDDAEVVATLSKESWELINRDVDARLEIQRAVKAKSVGVARKQLIAVLERMGLEYRLVSAPVHREGLDIWQRLNSAYGRAEVRAEAAAVNAERPLGLRG